MIADATLVATLTGGIYKRESVGMEGITRGTQAAFDANGYLLPCALVKQAPHVPDGQIYDEAAQIDSARQRIEIWLYEDRGYTAIDSAKARLKVLFKGHKFSNAAPILWLGDYLGRARDPGALKGNSMERVDFQVVALDKPT